MAVVGVKRRWVWILQCLAVVAENFVDFSRFVVMVAGGLMDSVRVLWMILDGLQCEW